MSAGNYEEDGGIRSGSEFGSPDLSIIPEDGVIRSGSVFGSPDLSIIPEDGGIRNGSVFGSPKLPQNCSVSGRGRDV